MPLLLSFLPVFEFLESDHPVKSYWRKYNYKSYNWEINTQTNRKLFMDRLSPIKCPVTSPNIRSHRIKAGHLSGPNVGLSHTQPVACRGGQGGHVPPGAESRGALKWKSKKKIVSKKKFSKKISFSFLFIKYVLLHQHFRYFGAPTPLLRHKII